MLVSDHYREWLQMAWYYITVSQNFADDAAGGMMAWLMDVLVSVGSCQVYNCWM